MIRRPALALLLALLSAGCSSGTDLPATSPETADQPQNFQLVNDIPIPAGAAMDNERSLILSDKDKWLGRLVMKLNMSGAEAALFFQNQMPGFNWTPIMSMTSDVTVMTYVRGDRACTIQIQRSLIYGSTVWLMVAPKQDGGAAGGGGFGASSAPVDRSIRAEPLPPGSASRKR
jgi:hypothetical protein